MIDLFRTKSSMFFFLPMNFLFSIQASRINNDTVGEYPNPPGAQMLTLTSCCSVNSGLPQIKRQLTLCLLIKPAAASELAGCYFSVSVYFFTPGLSFCDIHFLTRCPQGPGSESVLSESPGCSAVLSQASPDKKHRAINNAVPA